MAEYIAKADGLAGSHYVRAGDKFQYDGPKPVWAEKVVPTEAKNAPQNTKGGQAK